MERIAEWAAGLRALLPDGVAAEFDALGLAQTDWQKVAPWAAGLAALLAIRVLVALRVRRRRQARYGGEPARLARRVEAARAEAEARRDAETRRAGERFVEVLAAALRGGGPIPENRLPTGWLDEMRPALAEAYGLLAENALAGAETPADLERARRWACGALAAGAGGAETMLQAIDEAMRTRVFDRFGDAELLAWRIARLGPVLAGGAGPDGLPRESRYRTGAALRLCGWEPEDLREAALAVLAEGPAAAAGATPAAIPSAATGAAEATGETRGPAMVLALADRAAEAAEGDAAERREGERVLRLRRAGRTASRGPRLLRLRANQAWEAGAQGRHAEAERGFARIAAEMADHAALGPQHRDTLTLRHNLAWQIAAQGRLDEAGTAFRSLLDDIGTARLAKDDPLALAVRHALAEVAERRGARAAAHEGFRETAEAWERAAPADTRRPETLWSRVRMLRTATAAPRIGAAAGKAAPEAAPESAPQAMPRFRRA